MKAFHRPHDDDGELLDKYHMWLRIGWQSIFQIPQSETEFKKIDPKTLLNKDITCSVIFSADRLESDQKGYPNLALIIHSCMVLDVRDLPSEHAVDDSVIKFIRNNRNKIARANKLVVKEDPIPPEVEVDIPTISLQASLPPIMDMPNKMYASIPVDNFPLSSYLTPTFT